MAASVLYMSVSLDGYIAGPNDAPNHPGGDAFMRLHEWYGFGPEGPKVGAVTRSGPGGHFLDEVKTTSAPRAVRAWPSAV
jgi:hypothetical protein